MPQTRFFGLLDCRFGIRTGRLLHLGRFNGWYGSSIGLLREQPSEISYLNSTPDWQFITWWHFWCLTLFLEFSRVSESQIYRKNSVGRSGFILDVLDKTVFLAERKRASGVLFTPVQRVQKMSSPNICCCSVDPVQEKHKRSCPSCRIFSIVVRKTR